MFSEDIHSKLGAFLESTSDAVLFMDSVSGFISYANTRAMEIYGYSPDEFGKMTLDDLKTGTDDLAVAYGVDVWRGTGKPGRTKELHLAKDGRLLFVELAATEIELDGEKRQIVSISDQTEIRRKDEEILFLQEFNSSILDSLPFGITVKTGDGRVTYQNEYSKSVFGLLVGRTFREAYGEAPEFQDMAALDVALNDGESMGRSELDMDGREYSITALKVRDVRSDMDLRVELAQDITEGRLVQQELIKAQRMEAVGNLAGGIAHDFNNLLSGIMGYANLIHAVNPDDEKVSGYAEVIEKTCERASDLTRQLLNFSSRKSATKEVFNLHAIVQYAVKLLRHSLKKDIRIRHYPHESELLVKGDPAHIQQAVVNLGLNANDSMNKGRISIFSMPVEVLEGSGPFLRGAPSGLYAAISIEDSGRTGNVEALRTIFDPLSSRQGVIEPVDVRLSVVDAIVLSHDGRVLVDAEPGVNTLITVYLP